MGALSPVLYAALASTLRVSLVKDFMSLVSHHLKIGQILSLKTSITKPKVFSLALLCCWGFKSYVHKSKVLRL